MTRDEAVLAAGPYYHTTPIERVDGILASGLVPDYEMYEFVPCVNEAIVCVAPSRNRRKYLNTIASKSEQGAAAIFEIAAETILTLRYDLDCTNTELALIKQRLESDDFATLLFAGADLMIFDPIPVAALKRVPAT